MSTWVHPVIFGGIRVAHLVIVLCLLSYFYIFTYWVPCCDVRYDFHIKTMLALSLPPVVCKRDHVLFTLFVFVWFVFTSSCL